MPLERSGRMLQQSMKPTFKSFWMQLTAQTTKVLETYLKPLQHRAKPMMFCSASTIHETLCSQRFNSVAHSRPVNSREVADIHQAKRIGARFIRVLLAILFQKLMDHHTLFLGNHSIMIV